MLGPLDTLDPGMTHPAKATGFAADLTAQA